MDIGKTVHVTSVAQLQFYEATRIRFVCKGNQNNNLFNNSSPWVTIFHHFGEHHDACARFPQNVINVIISVVYIQHARFLLNVNNADWSHVVMMYFIYFLRLPVYFWGLYLGLNSWKFFIFMNISYTTCKNHMETTSYGNKNFLNILFYSIDQVIQVCNDMIVGKWWPIIYFNTTK